MPIKPKAVLFDLDGTLLDTAPDLAFALNQLRQEKQLPALPLDILRPLVSLGSKAMIKFALGIDENASTFNDLREQFLFLYQQHIADSTRTFPDIEKVLTHLVNERIPWGIVTNKLTRHTTALLQTLSFIEKPHCVICGDSLPTYKPDPAPIIYACELLKQAPKDCLYIGDSKTDVIASKRAGTKSLVALYGYIAANENPFNWQADGYIRQPIEIIEWLI